MELNGDFDEAAGRALDTAVARGAQYADVRFEVARSERIEVRNGIVAALADSTSAGFGVRALVDGAWGFAACRESERDAHRCDRRARRFAGARRRRGRTPAHREGPRSVPTSTASSRPCNAIPQDVPLGDRVALLLEAERALHAAPDISVGRAWIDLWRTDKYFYSTIGSRIAQRILQSGAGLEAMAVGDGDVQIRTYPGDVGLYQSGGWEIVEAAALLEGAPRIAEEASQLLRAPQCPSGTFDVILGGSQMSLQFHESCGHPAELDRVMGWEANFSGTSFLEIDLLGKLQYGSDAVTIVVDNTLDRGMATCGYDDEGTRSGRSDIVRDGVLAGYEMSNDTARAIGRESNACVRAQGWEFVPMIRMCNLNLLPGDVPFDALFDDVRDGIYMESNRSWSIDDRRLNFQFGCEIGWEVKNGKRGRMLKNPTYAGMTPAVLELVRRRRGRALVVCVGNAELRKGRADADRANDAGFGAGAFSQRQRRNWLRWIIRMLAAADRERIARRALALSRADQTEVLVSTSDAALMRFTHEASNQNVASFGCRHLRPGNRGRANRRRADQSLRRRRACRRRRARRCARLVRAARPAAGDASRRVARHRRRTARTTRQPRAREPMRAQTSAKRSSAKPNAPAAGRPASRRRRRRD